MVRKMASVVVAGLLVALVGCVGNEFGTGEGNSCSNADECKSELLCQPVTGRTGDFCCPSPLMRPDGQFTSSQSNCQPTTKAQ